MSKAAPYTGSKRMRRECLFNKTYRPGLFSAVAAPKQSRETTSSLTEEYTTSVRLVYKEKACCRGKVYRLSMYPSSRPSHDTHLHTLEGSSRQFSPTIIHHKHDDIHLVFVRPASYIQQSSTALKSFGP